MGTITRPTAERVAAWSGYPPERILGTADIGRRFGVTRQRAGQIARADRTFPRAGLHDRHGSAWVAAGVECWAALHRPRADTGRFGPDVAALLAHGEALAGRLGQGFVESTHLWHAMASGVAGPALADALCSLGVDPLFIEATLRTIEPAADAPTPRRRMTPAIQQRLEAADRVVRTDGRPAVLPTDLAFAFLRTSRERGRSEDHLLWWAERRGLDGDELRHRLEVVAADPAAPPFPPQPFPKPPPRSRRRRRPVWLDLAPNPLGSDPWERHPWGSVFARTREEQHLKVDGASWFFYLDHDGYFVRTVDGRPVGYRWWLDKKGSKVKPRGGRMEVLPMPPVPMLDWPDGRYLPED